MVCVLRRQPHRSVYLIRFFLVSLVFRRARCASRSVASAAPTDKADLQEKICDCCRSLNIAHVLNSGRLLEKALRFLEESIEILAWD